MARGTARTVGRSVTLAAASCLLVLGAAGLPAANPANAATARLSSPAAVPDPGSGSQLRAVTCTSASNCWAVGDYGNGPLDASEALHWDGTAWTLVSTPQPGGRQRQPRHPVRGHLCVRHRLLGRR